MVTTNEKQCSLEEKPGCLLIATQAIGIALKKLQNTNNKWSEVLNISNVHSRATVLLGFKGQGLPRIGIESPGQVNCKCRCLFEITAFKRTSRYIFNASDSNKVQQQPALILTTHTYNLVRFRKVILDVSP